MAMPSVPLRHIEASLRERFPENNTTRKDLNNIRQKRNKASLGGLTPTQALVKQFEDYQVTHSVRYDDLDPLRPTAMLWAYEWNTSIWRQFWWVLELDNTYKTNRFKMALFQACIVTNLGTVIPVVFGLVDNERQDGFDWLINAFNDLRIQCEIPAPGVIITDDEKALRNALTEVFPSADLQLCVFHINKNVVLNIKRKYSKRLQAARDQADQQEDDEPGHLYAYDGAGAPIPTQIEPAEEHEASALEELDLEARHTSLTPALGDVPATVEQSMAGVFQLWRHIVFAPTETHLEAAWAKMQAIFAP